MSLNIKNERTHALVRRLAALTGQSQTAAVTDAVERRLAEVAAAGDGPAPAARARIDRTLAAYRRDLSGPDAARLAAGDDALYDDAGLPR